MGVVANWRHLAADADYSLLEARRNWKDRHLFDEARANLDKGLDDAAFAVPWPWQRDLVDRLRNGHNRACQIAAQAASRRVQLLVGLHALGRAGSSLVGERPERCSRTDAKSLSSLHRLADTCQGVLGQTPAHLQVAGIRTHRKQPMTCWMWPSSRMKSRFNWFPGRTKARQFRRACWHCRKRKIYLVPILSCIRKATACANC